VFDSQESDDPYFVPKFSKDQRQSKKFSQGAFFGQAAPEDPAIRSTGSESAEMMVLPEETEESIARRSGLLAAEAAVSDPRSRPQIFPPSEPSMIDPETGRKMRIEGTYEPRSEADRAEFEALQKKVSKIKAFDDLDRMIDSGLLSSEYLTREYAEYIGESLREEGIYTGDKTGNALASYVLTFYGPKIRDIERWNELSEIQKKKSSP
jgi:hypothetical protein